MPACTTSTAINMIPTARPVAHVASLAARRAPTPLAPGPEAGPAGTGTWLASARDAARALRLTEMIRFVTRQNPTCHREGPVSTGRDAV